MVSVTDLRYRFGEKQLTYPDFEVKQGDTFRIIGRSGSGKTTLIHLMAGLRRLQEGKVVIGQTNIGELKGHEMDQFRGREIGLIYQKPHLLNTLTVKENLLSAQYFANVEQRSARAEEVLKDLNLSDRSLAKPFELSQGEAQRVAIARAVINQPALIIADEPTSSLDDVNCEQVLKMLIGEAHQNEATLIVVTHDKRVKDQITNGIDLNSL